MPRLLAVCVVHQLRSDAGTVGTTAIDKRPVDGPVKVKRLGLYADVQADRQHHGGDDKALYADGQDDADFWAAELSRELPPGWFGENLRLEGVEVSGATVGERWRIGETVEVEVTMPRTPCATFARWVGGADERGWVRRFAAAGRPGAYLRVVRTGSIAAGDPVTVLERPDAPSVAAVLARA